MDTDVAKLLPASAKITVDSLRIEPTFVELRIRGSSASACCTCCGTRSTRVHSRYERIIRDLPWRGTPVRIRFIARRFFCDRAGCGRKLFAEQIDELVERRGRATRRFDAQLVHLGLEAGGAPGARLARKQGTITSGSTILRRLRAMATTTARDTLASIGIDDFAFRRGSTYGTIVVDHSTGRPVDILPARDASLVAGWLSMHPMVQYVTRDRAGCYDSATSASLPDAVQIAHRWHLLTNARAALAHLLARLQPTIRAVAGELSQPIPAIPAVPAAPAAPAALVSTLQAAPVLDEPSIAEPVAAASSARLTKEQQLSHDRRLRRVARYERVLELDRQGLSRRAICRMLNMSQKTVASKLAAGQFVERARLVTHSLIDPYVKRVRDWWNEGDHDGRSLQRRVTALGCKASYCIVRRLVSAWRTPEERERISGPKVANPKSVRYRPPLPSGNHLS